MPVERREIVNTPAGREEWKAWRRGDVATASTVGALFGYHPWTTPLKLYVQARGVEFDERENKMMRRGRRLEHSAPAIVMDERPEWSVFPAGCYLRDPELRLGATPDFFVHAGSNERGVLQFKTTNPDTFVKEWGSGEFIPEWIIDQTLTEALLSEAEFAAVAVWVVERYEENVHIFDLPIDLARQARIVAAVARFRDDVEHGREPSPNFEKDAAVIAALAPRETPGAVCDLSGNNTVPELLARRQALHARITNDKIQCEVIDTELKYLMGDAERVEGVAGWRITYKTQNRKGYTVAPSSPRVLRVTASET